MDTLATRMFKLCDHRNWHRITVTCINTREFLCLIDWLEREAGTKWAYHCKCKQRFDFFVKDPVIALKFQAKNGL